MFSTVQNMEGQDVRLGQRYQLPELNVLFYERASIPARV